MSDELNQELTDEELEREIAEAAQVEKTEKVNQKKEPKSKPKKSASLAKASEQVNGAIATNANNLIEAQKDATRTIARTGAQQGRRDAATYLTAHHAGFLGDLSRATQANAVSFNQQMKLLNEHVDSEVDISDVLEECGVTAPLGEIEESTEIEVIQPFSIFQ